jgi:hypothetical protein
VFLEMLKCFEADQDIDRCIIDRDRLRSANFEGYPVSQVIPVGEIDCGSICIHTDHASGNLAEAVAAVTLSARDIKHVLSIAKLQCKQISMIMLALDVTPGNIAQQSGDKSFAIKVQRLDWLRKPKSCSIQDPAPLALVWLI